MGPVPPETIRRPVSLPRERTGVFSCAVAGARRRVGRWGYSADRVYYPGMNNVRIAEVFDLIADLLEFQGANPFRVRAYRNGARAIRDYPEPMQAIVGRPGSQAHRYRRRGQGPGRQDRHAAARRARCRCSRSCKSQVPQSVLTLLRIPGLGPKKAAVLFKELNICDARPAAGRLRGARGPQAQGLRRQDRGDDSGRHEHGATADERLLWAEADEYAQAIKAHLAACPAIEQMEVAGSYRRGNDTIGDLDFLVVASDVDDGDGSLRRRSPTSASVIGRGPTKISLRLAGGLQVDLRVVPAESFGAALLYFTGSKDHNIVLRGAGQGPRAEDQRVRRVSRRWQASEEVIAGRTEEEVYATLELPWIPPELREARREFEWAAAGKLPKLDRARRPARRSAHAHHRDRRQGHARRDGRRRPRARAEVHRHHRPLEARQHGPRARRRSGCAASGQQIDALNKTLARLSACSRGSRSTSWRRAGSTWPTTCWPRPIGSWPASTTARTNRASRSRGGCSGRIENPYVSAIAHPTGRLINRRKPYEVDLDAVFRRPASTAS